MSPPLRQRRSNVVDVYVGYLRRKVNRDDLPGLIQTVRGAGYRLLPPEVSFVQEPAGSEELGRKP
jgi:DNA-binding winged helix-turn-helix (wHTH) protein